MSRERDDRAVDEDGDVLRIDFRAATERGVDVAHDDQLPCHHPRRHGGALGTRLRVESRGRSACGK